MTSSGLAQLSREVVCGELFFFLIYRKIQLILLLWETTKWRVMLVQREGLEDLGAQD